jgi:hypothetical protein
MPKLKLDDDVFDATELDVEYEDRDFSEYDGEIPRSGTILNGQIKKVWFTISQNDNPMFRVLTEAQGNEGDSAEFNGLGVWDNVTFTPKAAFRYQPFLALFGLTIADVKQRTVVGDEDNIGQPVEKIKNWSPDTKAARCRIVIKREKYEGEFQARVRKYMPLEDGADWDAETGEVKGSGSGKKGKAAKGGKGKKGKGENPF